MTRFILNDKEVSTDLPKGIVILDFIRYHKNLTGTKIGCREGDCGACTVLVGELIDDELRYRSVTCCLMPIGNAEGKHIVTVEGINMNDLNPVQQAMSDEGATQCGFCTPGFVVSLAGFCLQKKHHNPIASIDGNICRCTGYKSIERAALRISNLMSERKNSDVIDFVVTRKILPEYFSGIKSRLIKLAQSINGITEQIDTSDSLHVLVGGGTDLYVQRHDLMTESPVHLMSGYLELKTIHSENNQCILGASVTVTDLIESAVIRQYFPHFLKYSKLISSTPIRNMATLAGNFVNASPIGDFTVFFLALDAKILLSSRKIKREIPLRNFYKGYKTLDKSPEEIIEQICFDIPEKNELFNFEKVSKRTNLDIASVNSAIKIKIEKNKIINAGISAGGVGPIPMYLKKTSKFLSGKNITEELVEEACLVAASEIAPISDARGTKEYKTLLLQQLIKAHFITLVPELNVEKLIY